MKHESGQPAALGPGSGDSAPGKALSARRALAWAAGFSLLLAWLPAAVPVLAWLAWPQVLISALAHELGHGVAALISGGRFDALGLYADGSGVALTRSSGGALQRAIIAAGGPLGPPIAALGLFVCARRAHASRVALGLIAMFLLATLVLWVRNPFGAFWVGSCALLAGAMAWRAPAAWAQALVCLVAVQLCLSTLSRLDTLFSRIAHTGAGELASDTGQLSALLGGPHWFWGVLIALLSAGVMLAGLWAFFRALRAVR